MFTLKVIFLFSALMIMILVITGLFLCFRISQKSNLKNLKGRKEQTFPSKKQAVFQEKIIHFVITLGFVLMPTIYLCYIHINQNGLENSDWSILAYILGILMLVLTVHAYLFPTINKRYLWRWGKEYKKYKNQN